MSTLLNMKIRIASELKRADLLGEIGEAITSAIEICQKYRFRFSEAVAGSPLSFVTTPAISSYAVPSPGMYQIDYMEQLPPGGGTTITKVGRRQPEVARLRAQLAGAPTVFALEAERILLAPTPDALYTILVHGHIKVVAPSSNTEAGNRWMTDGERMIRILAKREIARDVLSDKAMFDAMNASFIAEGMQLITEQDRLNFYEGMRLKTEDVPGQQKIVAPS